jgi:hypothetical protein
VFLLESACSGEAVAYIESIISGTGVAICIATAVADATVNYSTRTILLSGVVYLAGCDF